MLTNTGVNITTKWQRAGRVVPLLLVLSLVLAFCMAHATHAITQISQSYITKSSIPIGSLVSLIDNTTDQVAASTDVTANNIIGVAIDSDSSLLSINSGTGQQIQVATSGTIPVLVSDYGGPINQGDSITSSPIAGVGMKATSNVRIIGLAQATLDKGQKQSIKATDGTTKSVLLGQIPVLVGVSYFFKQPDTTIVPQALQKIANGIAGKKVSSLPIIVSAAVFIIMLIVVISIIYTMIRSSIISIGRNPMSQASVYRNLILMSTLVLGILTVGLVSIYLVLTKL